MQTTNQPDRYPYSGSKPNRPIPGIKIAYGSQTQQHATQTQTNTQSANAKPAAPNLFSKLKDSFLNMVTEEAPSNERPIGISRLSQTTFQASPNQGTTSFFKSSQPIQDYRFNQLIDPRLTNPRR